MGELFELPQRPEEVEAPNQCSHNARNRSFEEAAKPLLLEDVPLRPHQIHEYVAIHVKVFGWQHECHLDVLQRLEEEGGHGA